jgi:hypothetical protein
MGSFYAKIPKQMQAVDLVAVCGRSSGPVERLSWEPEVARYKKGD